MRNALEFAQDVADAFKAASGLNAQEVVDECSSRLATYDVQASYRKAVVYMLLSCEYKEEDEAARLLSLHPTASEAATYARAILTKTTRMLKRIPDSNLDSKMVAEGFIVMLVVCLLPESAKILGSSAMR